MDYLALDQHGGGRIWRDLACNHFTMEMVKTGSDGVEGNGASLSPCDRFFLGRNQNDKQ